MNRRILYVQYTDPAAYPPLEHSARLLASEGWQVLFLGVRKYNDPPLDWAPRDGITVRSLPPAPSGLRQRLRYVHYLGWILAWLVRWRPAWVYVSDALACPAGLLLSYVPGVRVVYHEHDTPQIRPHGIARRLALAMRRTLASRAAGRVLPNAARAEQFSRQVANHRPTFSVWNCPSRAEVGPPRESARESGLRLLYVGSVVPYRLPPSVFEALRLLPDEVRLRVIGYVTVAHLDYVNQLQQLARSLGVAHRTEFVEGMPHEQMLAAGREADVGLLLMPDIGEDASRQWMPGASNKAFDYLASGLALVVADEPGWRDLVVQPGFGLACDPHDAYQVANALRWFMQHPGQMRTMGERGRQRVIDDWNYEKQFEPVLHWMHEDRHSGPRTI
jgi:glycosyltransferase involved in cell wall biosynthesis